MLGTLVFKTEFQDITYLSYVEKTLIFRFVDYASTRKSFCFRLMQFFRIGPLQLAIHVVQNRRAGEQKSHWNKTNKENYLYKLCMSFVCLVPVRLALQRGSFAPREWLAAKSLFNFRKLN